MKEDSAYAVGMISGGGKFMVRFAAALACLAVTGALMAADEAADALTVKLKPVPPCAALAAAALTNQIPLAGFDALDPAGQLNLGDSVTALITLNEKGGRQTQWLIYLLAEIPKPPGTTTNASMVLYDSLGTKMEFASLPAPVTLRTLGPYVASTAKHHAPKAKNEFASFKLDQGFLGLGLDQAAAATYRLSQTEKARAQAKLKGAFSVSDSMPSAAEIARSRKANEVLKLTPEEERAIGGSCPALISYFEVVSQTQGLSDILFEIVKRPSLWSVVKNAGVSAGFEFEMEHLGPTEAADWCLPAGLTVYRSPLMLRLNNQRALDLTLLVTSPRPPLLACAGVVGVLAEKPGDNETYLLLRVISAHRAGPPK